MDRVLNITLRGATLGTRFVFIMILAKFLDPKMVGYYGLFTATVGYAIYFVGLDFYTYATREILRAPVDQRARLLKGQVVLSGGLYLLVLPVAVAILNQTNWPVSLLWWFAPILVLEHLNQELSRLLIALSQQLTASFVLFLRQGSWAIAATLLFVVDPTTRNLELIFALWATGGIAAAVLGAWKLSQLEIGGWRMSIDWSWIRRGIAVSLAFLVSTLALRAVQTLDRYWLEALGGVEIVAAYVLFMGVAGSLLVLLDAGVFAFTYPILIQLSQQNDHVQARSYIRRAFFQTLAVSAAFGVFSWFLLPYLLDWIGNPLYQNAIGLFPWILFAMILNGIGMIPHYALYARGFDKPIVFSHITALCIFVLTTWALSWKLSALAVPIGLNLSFLLILVLKSLAYFYLIARRKGDEDTQNISSIK